MYSSKTTNLDEISASSTKTEKTNYQNGNNTCRDSAGKKSRVYKSNTQNKSNTHNRQARTDGTDNLPPLAQANSPLLGRLTCTLPCIGLWCLLGIHIGFEAAAAAALDACVSWEGVKWAAKALIALLAAGLAEGSEVDCVGVPLAPGFGSFGLAGVPSPPPPNT